MNKVRSFLFFACPLLTVVILSWIDYMDGFKCQVTGSTSKTSLAVAKVPRRCGADPQRGVMNATPGNCTYGAKQPFYWFQWERNNVRVPVSVWRSGGVIDTASIHRRCSKAPILRPSTWTSTTSKTARRTTSSRIRTPPFLLLARVRRKSLLRSLTWFHNRLRRTPHTRTLPRGR